MADAADKDAAAPEASLSPDAELNQTTTAAAPEAAPETSDKGGKAPPASAGAQSAATVTNEGPGNQSEQQTEAREEEAGGGSGGGDGGGGGSDGEGDGEELDPRIEGELTRLNTGADMVNDFEKRLDKAKEGFAAEMKKVQENLKVLVKKCGRKSIEKARPYHQALFKARKAHFESRQAAVVFEKATSRLKAAKAAVIESEKRMMETNEFAPELQDALNRATSAVMNSEKLKRRADQMHSRTTAAFLEADQALMAIAKAHKKVILKTQPYFACKAQHDRNLYVLKQEVLKQDTNVGKAKKQVKSAMAALERISEEIHEKRRAAKEKAGVEEPSPAKPDSRVRQELRAADAMLAASDKRQDENPAATLEPMSSSMLLAGLAPEDEASDDDSLSEVSDVDATDVEALVHGEALYGEDNPGGAALPPGGELAALSDELETAQQGQAPQQPEPEEETLGAEEATS